MAVPCHSMLSFIPSPFLYAVSKIPVRLLTGVLWENPTVSDDKTNESRCQARVTSTMTDWEELSLRRQACFSFELINLNKIFPLSSQRALPYVSIPSEYVLRVTKVDSKDS